MKLRLTALLAQGQATACHSQFPKQVPRFCVNMRLDPSEGKRLVREHTSYPLIAPFLTPENRIRLLCWMLDDSRRLGRPGSRIFTGTHYKTYRFCPRCFEEQETRSGERYWRRMWQYPQLAVCPVHGTPLWDTQEPFQGISGSTRVISPYAVNCAVQLAPGPHDGEVLAALNDLLGEPLPLPSPEQWKQAYEVLCRGRTHDEIDEAVLRYWRAMDGGQSYPADDRPATRSRFPRVVDAPDAYQGAQSDDGNGRSDSVCCVKLNWKMSIYFGIFVSN